MTTSDPDPSPPGDNELALAAEAEAEAAQARADAASARATELRRKLEAADAIPTETHQPPLPRAHRLNSRAGAPHRADLPEASPWDWEARSVARPR